MPGGASAAKGRILVLCPFPPGRAPSQRFRFEQYLGRLRAAGFEVRQEPFWDEATAQILYAPGHTLRKVRGLLEGLGRRVRVALGARGYDYVFVHLEAAPVGPPFIEAALLAQGRRLIYDIDDAIFMTPPSQRGRLADLVRFRSKVKFIAKHSYKVLGVNPYLVEWARQFNDRVLLVPTTIDPDYHSPGPPRPAGAVPVLGWTGTHTTAPFLDVVRPALAALRGKRRFRLRVICNVDPGFPEVDDYEFVPWRAATEIEDLRAIDVGLMPVPDDPWSRGKVGFKAIQYSALGIAPVVSDVGSGREVVDDGRTGLVVENAPGAWVAALDRLLGDEGLRRAMGAAARERVLGWYSVPAQAATYLGLFT